MDKLNDLSESIIFSKGQKITNNYFIGDTWLEMLVGNDSTFNCPIGNVTFSPGARNNWHKHPGGQILLVTSGKGYYQEEGKEAQLLQAGDVVKISPNVKHWHGATADSWFAHIAISTNVKEGNAEWLEPVTDDEYSRLK
ncbi:cupin [Clostridium zeae]|uniref:Cupin n=1 Tax=Clostridium zeae TaxID=2759022 RepID=A0ABQ1E7M2_9CLOT|nr:cupin domain-containing protein [Clostridium zeae]GFZ30781.1 cupin [Clostridium zeae]